MSRVDRVGRLRHPGQLTGYWVNFIKIIFLEVMQMVVCLLRSPCWGRGTLKIRKSRIWVKYWPRASNHVNVAICTSLQTAFYADRSWNFKMAFIALMRSVSERARKKKMEKERSIFGEAGTCHKPQAIVWKFSLQCCFLNLVSREKHDATDWYSDTPHKLCINYATHILIKRIIVLLNYSKKNTTAHLQYGCT